jgi:hypothetical protein
MGNVYHLLSFTPSASSGDHGEAAHLFSFLLIHFVFFSEMAQLGRNQFAKIPDFSLSLHRQREKAP